MKNYSRQREEILEVLNIPGIHLTPEEVYNKVRILDFNISKATVYRNLKDLADEGVLLKVSMKDGIVKYDYPKEKHNHVICSKCGEVKDFFHDFSSKKLVQEIKKQTKMESDFETVIIYGVCDECKSKF